MSRRNKHIEKMYSRFQILTVFVLSLLILTSCNNSQENGNNQSSNTKQEKSKEEESIDGIYTGSQNVSGLELVAKLTISGNRWSVVSQLGYDSPEYQNGVVMGKDLYDDSGMIKIGYVSGSSASINGYPSMRR
jgi:uncharacterized protein with FMN-binding domain